MSPAEKRAREEQADRKSGEAAGRRYNALSSVEPSKDPRDDVRGQKGYKKGGVVKKRRYAEGGETDKEEGLKASKDEKVGFFERMRMGNIDEEGSEAYNRFGAGRGRAERAKLVPVEDRVATPVIRESAKAEKAPMDELEEANMREPIAVTPGKKAEPNLPTKLTTKLPESPKPSVKIKPMNLSKTDKSNYSNEGRSSPTAKTDTSNYSNEGRGRAMSKEQQFKFADEQARSPEGVARRKKMEKDQAVERVYPEEMLIGGPGLKGIQQLAKKAAGSTAPKAAGSRELSTAVDDGVTFLGKSGRRQVGGFEEVGRSGARKLSDSSTRRLPAPNKRLAGPDKKKDIDDEFMLEMKRGGKVKSMSSGGAAKPAVKGWGMARGARAAKMR
jgi:hypothetical protein